MFVKYVVFAFLLASPILASSQSQRLGFRNEHLANKAIAETIKNTIEKYLETAKEAYEEAVQAAKEQAEHFLNELNKDIEGLNEVLDSDCYAEYQKNLYEVNQKTIAELQVCVKDVVAQLTALFNDLVKSLNEINEGLLALLDEMNACDNAACYGGYVKRIAEEVLNVNKVMGDKITDFMRIVRENGEAKACVSATMEEYVGKAQAVVAEFRDCLEQ